MSELSFCLGPHFVRSATQVLHLPDQVGVGMIEWHVGQAFTSVDNVKKNGAAALFSADHTFIIPVQKSERDLCSGIVAVHPACFELLLVVLGDEVGDLVSNNSVQSRVAVRRIRRRVEVPAAVIGVSGLIAHAVRDERR